MVRMVDQAKDLLGGKNAVDILDTAIALYWSEGYVLVSLLTTLDVVTNNNN
jgi:hypothetical protein